MVSFQYIVDALLYNFLHEQTSQNFYVIIMIICDKIEVSHIQITQQPMIKS